MRCASKKCSTRSTMHRSRRGKARRARKVREKALKVAAQELEAAEADLELADGAVRIAGTNRAIPLAAIARVLRGVPGYSLPPGVEPGLEASVQWQTDQMAYAHSFHA